MFNECLYLIKLNFTSNFLDQKNPKSKYTVSARMS